jgi:hypothetical protein
MLTIDLLKGQGIPIKSRPGGAALLALVIAVPVVTCLLLYGEYQNDRIEHKSLKTQWSNLDMRILDLRAGVKSQESDLGEISNLNACLAEVHDTLLQHVQWTPVFRALVDNLPETLYFEYLNVKTVTEKKDVPKRNEPTQIVTIEVPRNILFIGTYSNLGEKQNEKVLEYIRKLNSLESLKDVVETIRLLAEETDNDKEIVRYSMECIFKN